MATPLKTETTHFTRDVLGRYLCNRLNEEALVSADPNPRPDAGRPESRPDARPFDIIIIGGGSFGATLAHHLFINDASHRHRILVLDGGPFVLPEHVQNLPLIGLGVPGKTSIANLRAAGQFGLDKPREEVWGLPWHSPEEFPGLAYCVGGRSVFFGGWSPQLLDTEHDTEMPRDRWPEPVVDDLNRRYFREASEQLGVNVTNDFIFGALHQALRELLYRGVSTGKVPEAIPLEELPLHLDDVRRADEHLFKVEAPLAVQGRPPRAGFFPFNKFSSVPLLTEAARAAWKESDGDDVKKRLLVVPNCHVVRLVTDSSQGTTRVTQVKTNQGPVPVPDNGRVIIALGTIESSRVAQISFPNLPNTVLIGSNLMAHLRSNLTIRIPRSALPGELPNELQTSALFVKGRHRRQGYFHLQITASGLASPSADSEAELFKKVPDFDTLDAFRMANDNSVVITIRGIGEMEPQNPSSGVTLDPEPDELGVPRAFVRLQPTTRDRELWDAMDQAAEDVAIVFANGQPYEVLTPDGFRPVAADRLASTVLASDKRRDGLGTTHHEAGTLGLGTDPSTSVTNADCRLHHVANAYVAGPALFPTIGSPNPMLTGVALVRRLGDHLLRRTPPAPSPGFQFLFDGTSMAQWRMSTIRNQPGRDKPGRFLLVDGALEAVPGTDIGLLWHTEPMPADFILKLEWRRWSDDDNSGVFVRFPHPEGRGYDNTAHVAVDFGFEVQIDQRAAPDGNPIHRTGAIYNFAAPRNPATLPVRPAGQWNEYEIHVQGQSYAIFLNGSEVTRFDFQPGSDLQHPDRGLPSTPDVPRFIGLQTHTGRVSFRHIQMKSLTPAAAPPSERIAKRARAARVQK